MGGLDIKRYRLLIRYYVGDKLNTMYRIGFYWELMELAAAIVKNTSCVSVDLEDITNQVAIGG